MKSAFVSHLKETLEKDPAVIYLLDRDLRIVYCNEAWDRFAAENGGRGLSRELQLGRSVMDAIPLPLKPFFEDGYRRALSGRQSWEHCYECSSPTVYRNFRMMSRLDPEGEALVVVNSITVERPHDDQERRVCFPDERVWAGNHDIVTMCCHCRRTCRSKQPPIWDWVPAYIEKPPGLVSHGICAPCRVLYYPDFA